MSKKKPRGNCLVCKKELSLPNKIYCNNTCSTEYVYITYIDKWKRGLETGCVAYGTSNHVRKYLFRKFDSKCQECGWNRKNPVTNKVPLNIEHVDGNWKNCEEENLKLLCPNCHSLTTTFGKLNNGNGREFRYKRV